MYIKKYISNFPKKVQKNFYNLVNILDKNIILQKKYILFSNRNILVFVNC